MTTNFSNDSFIGGAEDSHTSSYAMSEISLSSAARFWVILIFEIPSIICSLVLLYYFCFDRTLRQCLNNHVFTILLIVGLFSQTIDIPNILTFFRLGHVWPQTPLNCYVWWFVGTANFNIIGMLMAWASFERHILVFHNQWLNTQKKRIFIHYIPLTTIVLYSFIFYTICIFFLPCENIFDYTQGWCLFPCFLFAYNILLLYDTLINGVLPSLLISVFNILLFIRVIKQKQRLRQQIQWKKYRRMIIQLMSCSALFLLFNLPLKAFAVAYAFGLPYGTTGQFELFIYFISNFTTLWMPFVCLGSSPDIWLKIKETVRIPHYTTTITPQTLQTAR
ncbi:unnamed protein product [Rotaria sp. Silwood1]|nr:unnamed protein product [Rotaria sp. Silwood1]CAF3926316.1 unnamed protein product [Rotaria sp. Silwood1]